jgi:hypothetical protein
MCSPFNDGTRRGDFTRKVEDLGKGIFGYVRVLAAALTRETT